MAPPLPESKQVFLLVFWLVVVTVVVVVVVVELLLTTVVCEVVPDLLEVVDLDLTPPC